MWFAALNPRRESEWFMSFVKRVLDGSPPVLKLLEKNPFPDAPPKYLRASVYLYTFAESGHREGAWGQRKYAGVFMQQISLDDFKPEPEPETPGPVRPAGKDDDDNKKE